MPAAVMMSGTIIGEIRNAMIARRPTRSARLRPSAATVPMAVASTVATTAMMRLLRAPITHLSLHTVVMSAAEQSPTIILYHRVENASGSSRSISGVKSRNGDEVNESGMTAMRGMTRKNRTMPQ